MSPFKKGNIPWCKGTKGLIKSWNKGKHNIYSKETIEKIRAARIGKSPWNKGKHSAQVPWNKGKKGWLSEIQREHIRQSNKNRKSWNKGKHNIYSKETIEKIRAARKLQQSWNKGKTGVYSKEVIEKMSAAHSGDKSHFWKGGISHNPYSVDWNKSLRRSIRERDRYACQLCGELQSDRAFSVHHIDYDKNNCNPTNLITLCIKCHTKTNANREFWKSFFSENLELEK